MAFRLPKCLRALNKASRLRSTGSRPKSRSRFSGKAIWKLPLVWQPRSWPIGALLWAKASVPSQACESVPTSGGTGRLGLLPLICLAPRSVDAWSATWNLNPTSSDWNAALNWTPNTVPNGPADVASFGLSDTAAVSIQVDIEVESIVFNPGASPFSFTMDAPSFGGGNLTISGTGITNNSAVLQNFSVDGSGIISFTNAATAGNGTIFTLNYYVEFGDTSTAGTASFVANGAPGPDASAGGVIFWGNSTAGDATFILNGATVDYAFGGLVTFSNSSTAGNGVFVLNGPTRSGPYASTINFAHSATAGNGIFTLSPDQGIGPKSFSAVAPLLETARFT